LGAWRPGLPVRFVAVHPPGTPLADLPDEPGDGGPDRVDVVDADGVLGGWLRRHGADLVVLRPDRFVFALVTADGIERAGRDLSAALGAPPRGGRNPADTAGLAAAPGS
ncbi:monooxygenase, partial [Micromonospora chalcea]